MINGSFSLFIGTCMVGGLLHFAAVSSTVLAQDSQGNPPSASPAKGGGVDSADDVKPERSLEAAFETMTLRLAQTILSAAKEEAERQRMIQEEQEQRLAEQIPSSYRQGEQVESSSHFNT